MRRRAHLTIYLMMVLLVTAARLSLQAPVDAQAPDSLRIDMTEFAYRPSRIQLTAGRPAKLVFVNRGQIAHQFETDYLRNVPARITDPSVYIESPGVDILRLEPGRSATLIFTPRARGRFTFACTIEGHREAGMKGILEVR